MLTTPLPRQRARWLAGRGEGFDYNALPLSLSPALALAVDVPQFNRCQIARSILYCSIIIVGPFEEAKSQVQRSHEYELSFRRGKDPSARFYRSYRPSRSILQL